SLSRGIGAIGAGELVRPDDAETEQLRHRWIGALRRLLIGPLVLHQIDDGELCTIRHHRRMDIDSTEGGIEGAQIARAPEPAEEPEGRVATRHDAVSRHWVSVSENLRYCFLR